MAKKVSPVYEMREIVYSEERWTLLEGLRRTGMRLIEALSLTGIEGRVHGSVARGDVGPKSDVDVFIPEVTPSHLVEGALLAVGFQISKREMTQATPVHTIKGIIHIDSTLKLTFPLFPLRGKERDFYRFGGEIGAQEILEKRRVAGVDKRLMLVVPTELGHYEWSILDDATEAAKTVGVSLEVVNERIRVLRRRDRIGRTGIYYKEELGEHESFERKLGERLSRDPSVRRLLQRRHVEFKY